MPSAMIITVGAQGEQIIFSLKEINPEYIKLHLHPAGASRELQK